MCWQTSTRKGFKEKCVMTTIIRDILFWILDHTEGLIAIVGVGAEG